MRTVPCAIPNSCNSGSSSTVKAKVLKVLNAPFECQGYGSATARRFYPNISMVQCPIYLTLIVATQMVAFSCKWELVIKGRLVIASLAARHAVVDH